MLILLLACVTPPRPPQSAAELEAAPAQAPALAPTCAHVDPLLPRAELRAALTDELVCAGEAGLQQLNATEQRLLVSIAIAELAESGPGCALFYANGRQPWLLAEDIALNDAQTWTGTLGLSVTDQPTLGAPYPDCPGCVPNAAVSDRPRVTVSAPLRVTARVEAGALALDASAPELCPTLIAQEMAPDPRLVPFARDDWKLVARGKTLLSVEDYYEGQARQKVRICPPGAACKTHADARVLAEGARWTVEGRDGPLATLDWTSQDGGTAQLGDVTTPFSLRFEPAWLTPIQDMLRDNSWYNWTYRDPAIVAPPTGTTGDGFRVDEAARLWWGGSFVPGRWIAEPLACEDSSPGAVFQSFIGSYNPGVPAVSAAGEATWVFPGLEPCHEASRVAKRRISAAVLRKEPASAPAIYRRTTRWTLNSTWQDHCLVQGMLGVKAPDMGVVCVDPPGGIGGVILNYTSFLDTVSAAQAAEGASAWRADQVRFATEILEAFAPRPATGEEAPAPTEQP